MEKQEKNKNTKLKIIIGVIILIVVVIVGCLIARQIKINNAKKQVEKSTAELRNILNGGISSDGTTSISQETIDYINNSLVLESAKVEEFNKYYYDDEKVWGLTDIKIKNNGDKSIKQVTITVYFKDDSGNIIGENNINIGISDIYNTVSAIKPNYEWASEKDTYYELKNLTDSINPTKNEIKITDLKFEN